MCCLYDGYNIDISPTNKIIYLGIPRNIGEKSSCIEVDCTVRIVLKAYSVDYQGDLGGMTFNIHSMPEDIKSKLNISYRSVAV